ncbi:MAG: AAA family ATPase [Actinobacteria bacterium]|nr:AAA family ATPase [Actinomycetota bacterium]
MEYRILGALEVAVDGKVVAVGGSRERALLALLLLRANQVVPADTLVEELWGGRPTEAAENTLRVYVSRLRKALRLAGAEEVLVTQTPGYVLRVQPDELDASRFEAAAAVGKQHLLDGDAPAASAVLRDALALWRGPALVDLADLGSALPEAARLEERRLEVTEDRIEADLACGRHREVVGELELLTGTHPLRERLWGHRMLALYRSGRQAEALRAYQDVRALLGDQLGIDPGPELRRLEDAILQHAPELDWEGEVQPVVPPSSIAGAVPTTPFAESAPVAPTAPAAAPPAEPVRVVATGLLTLLFTDIAAFDELLEREGDEAAERRRRTHLRLVREAAGAWQGSEPKSLAAGLLLTFTSAVDAVACAVSVQQAIERHDRRYPDERLETRIGLHVGESIIDEADYFGPDVVTARRVCESAVAGQILATEVVASLVGSRGQYRFADHGSLDVRGVSRPITTHTVLWQAAKAIALPLPRAVATDQQPFVGRSDESDVLEAAWEEATKQQRQAVLIGGEPGIGKTRLATEFALRAHAAGATVLWGRCDEELGVAYQPFAEALRQYVEVCPVEDLQVHVDAYGGTLARLVPEMELRLPELAVPAAGDPEADRYYLFEAATGLIGTATERAPVVLVIDDLHWAARPTMLMLRHLLRSQHAQALFVIATYRDTEIGGGHPLAELLADLRSVPGVYRLAMEGLGVHDLADLVAATGDGRLNADRRSLAQVLSQETQGNPFFVGEILRHLTETQAGTVSVPESVRDVIARRLSRLSPSTQLALATAAVVGPAFEFGVLERLGGAPDDPDELLDALDEAIAARVVTEVPGGVGHYTFTNSLIRHTLYEGLSTARRSRIHLRAGEALEALHADAIDAHVAALAHHFCEAAIGGQPSAKAADYALRAARIALDQLAFESAVAHVERGLAVLEANNRPDLAHKFDLLLVLATAQDRLLERTEAKTAVLAAAQLAREVGSNERLVEAALALAPRRGFGRLESDVVELCEQALRVVPAEEPAVQAKLLAFLAAYRAYAGEGWVVEPLALDALATARDLGDAHTLFLALMARCWTLWGKAQVGEQVALAEEVFALGDSTGNPLYQVEALLLRAPGRLALGDRDGFEADGAELENVSGRMRFAYGTVNAAVWQTLLAFLDGRFEEAETLAGAVLALAGNDEDWARAYASHLFWLRFEQGRSQEVVEMVLPFLDELPVVGPVIALLQADAGDATAAREVLNDVVVVNNLSTVPQDLTWPASLACLTEVIARVEDADAAKVLDDALRPYGGQLLVVGGTLCPGSADRYLGMVAAVMGRTEEAEARFTAALELERSVSARPLVARTCYWYGRFLLSQGPPRAADGRARVEEARAIAAELGMAGLEVQASALI